MRTATAVLAAFLAACTKPPQASEGVIISSQPVRTSEEVSVEKKVVATQGIRDCAIRNDASELTLRVIRSGEAAPEWFYQVQENTYPGSQMFVSAGGRTISSKKNAAPTTTLKELRALGSAPMVTFSYTDWPYGTVVEKTTTLHGLDRALEECSQHVGS